MTPAHGRDGQGPAVSNDDLLKIRLLTYQPPGGLTDMPRIFSCIMRRSEYFKTARHSRRGFHRWMTGSWGNLKRFYVMALFNRVELTAIHLSCLTQWDINKHNMHKIMIKPMRVPISAATQAGQH